MDDTPCRLFFIQPTADPQRLYEALRAVFVDGCRQIEEYHRSGQQREEAEVRGKLMKLKNGSN